MKEIRIQLNRITAYVEPFAGRAVLVIQLDDSFDIDLEKEKEIIKNNLIMHGVPVKQATQYVEEGLDLIETRAAFDYIQSQVE